MIDRTLLRNLGGLEGILAAYLDDAVLSFPPQEQTLVRLALGALVGSSGIKQRLPLEAVARVATAEPDQVAAVLDTLTDKRLVRRYDVRQADATRIEYELVHDYLVAGIARLAGAGVLGSAKTARVSAPGPARVAGQGVSAGA